MGFLFLVLYPLLFLLLPPPRLPPHSLTHSLITHHSLTHSLTPSLPHSLTPSLPHSLTPSLPHSLTPSLTHSLTHSLTSSLISSHLTLTHSLTHCQGVGCTPWLGLRSFCVAGVGQCALPRGRMYALASLRCPLVSAAFAWQAWDNVHCQGVGCTPWRPSGVPWSPPLLRGRRGTMCTAKGSDVRPGVPPVSLGLRRFCVAGVGQCALPRGRMYALASLRCPSGVPWSPPLLRGRRGTKCTAKGSDVRPGVPPVSLRCPLVSAAFAWQAWDNVHCQGVRAACRNCSNCFTFVKMIHSKSVACLNLGSVLHKVYSRS